MTSPVTLISEQELVLGRAQLRAGSADPGLLTVAARELLLDADVVFHDALVSAEILALCGAGTRLVDIGKRGGGVCAPRRST